MTGCIRCSSEAEGLSTWFGQTDTQSWQAVQRWKNFLMLSEPKGVTGTLLAGACRQNVRQTAVAFLPVVFRVLLGMEQGAGQGDRSSCQKARLPMSDGSLSWAAEVFLPDLPQAKRYFSASNLQLSRQLKQFTQRL